MKFIQAVTMPGIIVEFRDVKMKERPHRNEKLSVNLILENSIGV